MCTIYNVFLYCTMIAAHKTMNQYQQTNQRLQFHLCDNTPAGHPIGSIFTKHMTTPTIQRVILSSDDYFQLNLDGKLYTKIDIDRDIICHRFQCCESEFCHLPIEAYIFDTSPKPMAFGIDILIADENDNPPVFPTSSQNATTINCSWLLSIPESAAVGTEYALPTASDKDSSRFGACKYKIIQSQSENTHSSKSCPFSLIVKNKPGDSSPKLRLDSQVDRELKSSYQIRLVAEDAGDKRFSSEIIVCINIQDVNDNVPMFELNNSTGDIIEILENITVGSVIGRFSAVDLDEGPNQELTYLIDWMSSIPNANESILNQLSSKYMIHSHLGELRIAKPLDFENEFERQFTILIKVVDHGSPKLSSSLSVRIRLLDVNDNDPVIEILEVTDRNILSGSESIVPTLFRENSAESQLLKLITVSDADSISKGKLSCKLSEQYQNDFYLTAYSSNMYGLVNSRAFDYEQEASPTGHLAVLIKCFDDVEPKRLTQKWIRVPLEDLNDNWPQFDRSNYHMSVSENVELGHQIGQVHATDADSNNAGSVTYEMTSDEVDYLQYVQIDAITGIIHTVAQLDREKLNSMNFRVTARDSSGSQNLDSSKTNTTSVTIDILDENDNAPQYTGPNEIHVLEDIPIGTEVHTLTFTDYDLGLNGSVNLRLSDQSTVYPYGVSQSPFSIVDNFRLITNTEIDRERNVYYILKVFAFDRGTVSQLSTTVSLTIHVDDVNDNHPELVYPKNHSLLHGNLATSDWVNNMATIPADTPSGTPVSVIHGKDPDNGENATVNYRIIRSQVGMQSLDSYGYFGIDSTKGHVFTNWGEKGQRSVNTTKVDIPNPTPQPGLYSLHIQLCDGGTPTLCTTALFYVNVSHPVGGNFIFGIFGGGGLNNTVMLVLILICSLALVISLIAAIVWVRYRKDVHRDRTGRASVNDQGYIGPTVICQENEPNGYYYPAILSAVEAGQDYDSHGIIVDKEHVIHSDTCAEFPPLLCAPNGTLLSVRLSATQARNLEMNSIVNNDSNQWYPTCLREQSLSLNNSSNTKRFHANGVEYLDKKCVTFCQTDSINQCRTTTNSAAESDSGVDSGNGMITGASLGPLYAASYNYDIDVGGDVCLNYSKPSVTHLPLAPGLNLMGSQEINFTLPTHSTASRKSNSQIQRTIDY